MALSANTILEVRTPAGGGDDTNGGGFVAGASGTDWSQQSSPQYSVADGVTAGTTTITSASANFGTDVVGNLIAVSGGTGSVALGWYQIISRTNATTIVVDRATGLTSGTGVTLKIGGALASIGGLGKLLAASGVALMSAYVRGGTYTLTSATVNIAGGTLDLTVGAMALQGFQLYGYGTTRGDSGIPVISLASLTSVQAFRIKGYQNNAAQRLSQLQVSGANNATSYGFVSNGLYMALDGFWKCAVVNVPYGFYSTNSASASYGNCYAESCSIAGFLGGNAQDCEAKSCYDGFVRNGTGAIWAHCLARNCTNIGFSSSTWTQNTISYCTSVDNTYDGFYFSGDMGIFNGNLAAYNGRYGINSASSTAKHQFAHSNAVYGNTTSNWNNPPPANYNYKVLTGDPFVNRAGGDYRVAAGSNAYGAIPACYSQIGNRDFGAEQHADAGGSAFRAASGFIF